MTKIAMMTAWNTDSGVAVHAESIGKAEMPPEFLEAGRLQ